MPLIVGPAAMSCGAERLAGVSGKHGVDNAAPRSAVEGGEVGPDWRGGEVSGPLSGDEGAAGIFLPLDKASRVEFGLCEHEAHVKATGSGT